VDAGRFCEAISFGYRRLGYPPGSVSERIAARVDV
jgi:hypothetical protein